MESPYIYICPQSVHHVAVLSVSAADAIILWTHDQRLHGICLLKCVSGLNEPRQPQADV